MIKQREINCWKNSYRRVLCCVLVGILLCAGLALGYIGGAETVFADTASAPFEEETETEKKIAVDVTGQKEGFSTVLYDNPNGLPTSEANAIAETSEGFLWIGSYSGLIRYDGNTFERFDSTTGVASVVSLFVDSRDRLWIGTNDSGVAVMGKGDIQMFGKNEGLQSSSVQSIAEDADGTIYVATTRGIVLIDDSMSVTTLEDSRISEEYIRHLRAGADQVLYGVTINGAVFTMEQGEITGFYDRETLGIDDIHSVLPDANHPGYVYLGTERSDLYYGNLEDGFQNPQVIDVSPIEYINSMEQFGDQIWICADNGIGTVENGTVTLQENIPLNNSVEQMMTDYSGNLWFVSSRQGVMKVVPNQFTNVFKQYGLDETVVNSTCAYEDQLFIGTDTGLIVIGKEKVVHHVPIKKAKTASGEKISSTDLVQLLNGCRIRSIIRDGENRLWFSTYSEYALVRYDQGVVTCFGMEDGLPSNRVRTIYERADGTIMVICTGGLVLIQDDQVTKVYNESSGIQNTEILTGCEAENGDMLLGSDGDGIYVVQGDQVLHLDINSGLGSEIVMRIKKDSSRNIYWIVTSNSIAYMTEDYEITTIEKFPYSNNFDLYENSKGEMWVLSSNGIYVVSLEELLANGEIAPVYYSLDNGLPCITTANSYSELTEDGDLYVAASTGIAKVNIETPFEDVADVKMAVPFVKADDTLIFPNASGNITIPSSTKKLTIYGFVYTYSLMNPKVTYYLQGFDQKKTTVNRSDLVPLDYTNLKGGTYHFVMHLKDSMGRGDKELSIQIVKQKGIREMLWYRILIWCLTILVIAAVIWMYYLRKTRVLLRKQKETNTFIREMTEAFARIIDMKDEYTNGHSTRVAEYTAMLTRELGYDEETTEKYYNIALLHDIGKIGVPSKVLNKKDKLTDEEYHIMQSHTTLGYNALKDISIMPELATGAGAHHERPDGRGYPNGLKGNEIPRVAQIIAVADTFDAMYSTRPYRKRMNFDKVVSIIREGAGTQLESDVVGAFLRLAADGKLRAPDDDGGGTTENIDNVSKYLINGEEKK